MRADKSRYKSLFPSHWASALKLVGKVRRPYMRGAYLVSRLTQVCPLCLGRRMSRWRSQPACLTLSRADWGL